MTGYRLRLVGLLSAALLLALLGACSASAPFEHDVGNGPRPWTDKPFDTGPDKFTFAIFSDLTGGERERVFEIAVAQLALLRPEFILNVGDLIEGDSADAVGVAAERDSFDERAHRAKAPIFYVGGNHDLTGELLQRTWDARYGRRYYHFVYKGVLFLVLDTEDASPERGEQIFEIRKRALAVLEERGFDAYRETEYFHLPERETGSISGRQVDYFSDVLAEHDDVRWTFLLMHKPAWLREEFAAFEAIEEALGERPYTVFAGHFHTYRHSSRRGRDYIRLATTGGVQIDGDERSMDHVTLVTVDDDGVDIANLLLEGILDRAGHVPLGGDEICFEAARCGAPAE